MSRVSIVITTYRETARAYLDACVASALALKTSHDVDVLIVAPRAYNPRYEGARTVCPPESEYGMPRGLNFGMHASTGEYMLVLNDDVILTHSCLDPLVSMMAESPTLGLLMPYGNDSNLNRYALASPLYGPYRLEQLNKHEVQALMNCGSPYPPGAIMARELCLYAFLIRREVFAKVGDFDETLIGQDDLDFSRRVEQAGYALAINIASLVLHAGGASNQLNDAQRAESMRRFNEKWGQG